LNPDVFQAQDLRETAHRYDHYLAGADQAGGALLFELEHELVQNQLARIDRLTMAHGLEARVPFLDRRFAEFAFNLAFDLKKNRGLEKRVLRQAMESSLPPEVVYRPKSGPAGTQGLLPIWSEHLLAPLVAEYLNPKAIRERGWFRPRRLLAYLDMLDRPVIKKHPIWGRRRQKMIYALVMLELWARLFMDNKEEP
jgi:asparagine synthase (glutamine-hydrolysing)